MFELDAVDLEKLIEAVDRSGLSEFSLVTADGEIRISKSPGGSAAVPGQTPVPATGLSTAPASEGPSAPAMPAAPAVPDVAGLDVDVAGLERIRTPLLGAFYRSPEPGAPPFVDVGTRVEPETTVAIIEAMKVFTSVQAGVSGVIREVLVKDREFVEHEQALFVVETDDLGDVG